MNHVYNCCGRISASYSHYMGEDKGPYLYIKFNCEYQKSKLNYFWPYCARKDNLYSMRIFWLPYSWTCLFIESGLSRHIPQQNSSKKKKKMVKESFLKLIKKFVDVTLFYDFFKMMITKFIFMKISSVKINVKTLVKQNSVTLSLISTIANWDMTNSVTDLFHPRLQMQPSGGTGK